MIHADHRRGVFGRWLAVSLLCALPWSAWAGGDDSHRAGQLRAMTQNLYVGAEILGVAAAPDLCTLMSAAHGAVQQVLANDFGQRAEALARLIAADNPEVVGLQEAFQVILTDLGGTPYFFQDYAAMLLAALDAEGATYYAAATRGSDPLTVPADADGNCDPQSPSLGAADYAGTIVDHDIILCRDDVECTAAADANFVYNAGANTPAGPIEIQRGWVSVVASHQGRSYRVLNTHLEVDSDAAFRSIQYLQAAELAQTLGALSADGLPQVVLGDFNSEDSPDFVSCLLGQGFCPTGYQVMAAAGFIDAWTRAGGRPTDGYTCCQDADLRNPESAHASRIDQVWVRGSTAHYGGPQVRGVRARVIGTDPADRSAPDSLWPSDHAGVSADLVLRTPK